jgi:hypothetical protein
MGDEYIDKNILPFTQLGRLFDPTRSPMVSLHASQLGGERESADAGWHAPA